MISTRRPVPGGGLVPRGEQCCQLVVAPDQRDAGLGDGAAASPRLADDGGVDRLSLSLDEERLELRGLEHRARSFQHLGGRDDLVVLGLGHQPGGEVDRVSHDGVRATVEGPDLAGEDGAPVDSDVERQLALSGDDRAEGEQHLLLVVPRHVRRTGGEDDLAPVRRDVGAEERHLPLVDCLLDAADERVELRCCGLEPLPGQECVERPVVEEGHGDRAVLGLDACLFQGLAQRCRDESRQVDRGGHLADLAALRFGRSPREKEPRPELPSDVGARQRRRQRGADQDLPRRGCSLHRDRLRRGRACDDQLPVGAADQEEVEDTGVRADRHAQRHLAGGRGERADPAQLAAHPVGCGDGAVGVPVALEEEQQCVAAELDQAALVGVGLGEERPERVADHVRDLLGTDLALPRQALRHLCEPGHVDEHRRALELPSEDVGSRPRPVEHQAREVRLQRGRHDAGHPALRRSGSRWSCSSRCRSFGDHAAPRPFRGARRLSRGPTGPDQVHAENVLGPTPGGIGPSVRAMGQGSSLTRVVPGGAIGPSWSR